MASASSASRLWRHSKDYEISTDVYFVYPTAKARPPRAWRPDLSLGLDASLPVPWPENYVNAYKQNFNPWVFFKNAAMLSTYYRACGDPLARSIMLQLYQRLLEHSVLEGEGRFIIYSFRKRWRKISMRTPWTSAYASGAGLIGLSLMGECLSAPEILKTAREVFYGLASPIDPRRKPHPRNLKAAREFFNGLAPAVRPREEHRPRYWVSFVDDNGFLWFEEMPLDQKKQPRILNGHIRAIIGLYVYWAKTRDAEALELLRAGIYTVEKHALEYRIPGQVNRYDLLGDPFPDYGPARTINQQGILFKMTADPIFDEFRKLFEQDMASSA